MACAEVPSRLRPTGADCSGISSAAFWVASSAATFPSLRMCRSSPVKLAARNASTRSCAASGPSSGPAPGRHARPESYSRRPRPRRHSLRQRYNEVGIIVVRRELSRPEIDDEMPHPAQIRLQVFLQLEPAMIGCYSHAHLSYPPVRPAAAASASTSDSSRPTRPAGMSVSP
jgi:hypothetical protein